VHFINVLGCPARRQVKELIIMSTSKAAVALENVLRDLYFEEMRKQEGKQNLCFILLFPSRPNANTFFFIP
jgi:hypothetical protein